MRKIKIIQPEEAEGRLKEIYDDLIAKRGKLAEVHKIQSLRPESIVKHMDLYMEIMYSRSLLSRAEREMIAVVVSAANQCEYCQIHHAAALEHYWKDQNRVEKLRKDYKNTELSPKEKALCEYAAQLTLQPAADSKFIETLKNLGMEDAALLDASLVIAYFNFVNRMVLGLGVHLESDEGSGYKY